MCQLCSGTTRLEVEAAYRQQVRAVGLAVAHVPPTGGRPGFSYTVGLTRHHGHPELLVSGLAPAEATALIAHLEGEVRRGRRRYAGEVIALDAAGAQRLQVVEVADPERLAHAQALYASPAGPVPGLQVVWSDDEGRWPWQAGWAGLGADQPLFGPPVHR